MITDTYKIDSVERIFDLRNVAKTFFEKSLVCTKVSDVQAFFALAQQANESADLLESDIKIESCWTYLHFVQYFGYSCEYEQYVEFCIRNRFAPVSEIDLKLALTYKSANTTMDKDNATVVQ